MRFLPLLIICMTIGFTANAQVLFYEDAYKGGATAAGGSPGYTAYTPSDFSVSIPPGSTIRQAWLMAGRHGNAPDTEVDLNGFVYTFSDDNQVSPDFDSPFYGGASGVHAIDVTADIDPAISDYTLTVIDLAAAYNPANLFLDYYLFIAYENPSLDSTYVAIYVNEQDLDDKETWELTFQKTLDTACADVGLALMTGYACYLSDGENVEVNGTFIGTYGGNEDNSGDCGGPVGSFSFNENTLTGIADDDADELMNETDVVAEISSYIDPTSDMVDIFFEYVDPTNPSGDASNAIWALVLMTGNSFTEAADISVAQDSFLICQGESVNLSVSGGSSYEWEPSTGLSDPFSASTTATPEMSTTYVVTSSAGCAVSFDTVVIEVVDLPLELGDNITICETESTTIGVPATPGFTYTWLPESGLLDANVSSTSASPESTTAYILQAVSTNGCVFTDGITIVVSVSDVELGNDTTIVAGTEAILSATGEGDYDWVPATGDCNVCPVNTVSPLENTLYTIIMMNADGCFDSDSMWVFVDENCGGRVLMPSAFTPNGDGINDQLLPATVFTSVDGYDLMIYNRWGEQVFASNDILNGWNGEVDDIPQPLGAYTYILRYTCSGDPFSSSGLVYLLR